MSETLAEKTCTPCRGGIPPLTRDEAGRFQTQAPNWELRDNAHRIQRTFRFRNFREALAFDHKAGSAVYEAGAPPGLSPTPPYPSTHNLGTCRMSENPRDGVCNKFGQTHDVRNLFISDGSQFTTGGAENPTLTMCLWPSGRRNTSLTKWGTKKI
jgi:choline dehydrogenase-like flavoprotein